MALFFRIRCVSVLLLCLVASGCATPYNRIDPLEPLNRGIYSFNKGLDNVIVKPVAQGYKAVIPDPFRMLVRNFFSNLDDVVVVFNDLLQFKLLQALQDTTRIVVNSTIGFFGIADIASGIGLEKHNEDFGQTLGYWGIGNGPYLVLPILGPSSVRDTVGIAVDVHVDPIFDKLDDRRHFRQRNQLLAAKFVSKRTDLLDVEKVLEEAAIDEYVFVRDAYLQRRRSLIYDGNPPPADRSEDESDEPIKRSDVPLSPEEAPAAAPEVAPEAPEKAASPVTEPVSSAVEPQAPQARQVAPDPLPIVAAVTVQASPQVKMMRVWLPASGLSN